MFRLDTVVGELIMVNLISIIITPPSVACNDPLRSIDVFVVVVVLQLFIGIIPLGIIVPQAHRDSTLLVQATFMITGVLVNLVPKVV